MITRFTICAVALVAFAAVGADAQRERGPVTFTKDILPILQDNCQECHRPSGLNLSGMVAPMSLMTYEEVRPWAKSIVRETTAKRMPPWFASEEFTGVFELERGLTDEEIRLIEEWTNTGARRGNPEDAPAPRQFASTEGWVMGEPDVVIKMPEPYWVADDVEDIQPSFDLILTEDILPEDRWIHWIEFRPGSDIIHHGGASVQPLGSDGEPIVDPISGGKVIGTAQGDGPDVWPEGFGKLVRKGSRFIFNIHYNKEPGPGTGRWDQSMIAIKWHDKPVKHVVRAAGISTRGWEIPPYHGNWEVGAARTFDEDTYIINMMPHMHWRGNAARYVLNYPDGTQETILDVPRYDFAWQQTYTFKEPKFAPAGSRLEVSMWFDNSSDNQWVPDPERPIGFGSMTKDEMNIGWTEYSNAHPIDDIMNHDFGDMGTGVEDVDFTEE
jgi:mono/diheme cytochrome c family protein